MGAGVHGDMVSRSQEAWQQGVGGREGRYMARESRNMGNVLATCCTLRVDLGTMHNAICAVICTCFYK